MQQAAERWWEVSVNIRKGVDLWDARIERLDGVCVSMLGETPLLALLRAWLGMCQVEDRESK